MFEDSLMESGGKIKTKSKYWSIVTLCYQRRDPGSTDHLAAVASRGPAHADDGHAAGCPTAPTAPSPATTTSGSGPGQDQV